MALGMAMKSTCTHMSISFLLNWMQLHVIIITISPPSYPPKAAIILNKHTNTIKHACAIKTIETARLSSSLYSLCRRVHKCSLCPTKLVIDIKSRIGQQLYHNSKGETKEGGSEGKEGVRDIRERLSKQSKWDVNRGKGKMAASRPQALLTTSSLKGNCKQQVLYVCI